MPLVQQPGTQIKLTNVSIVRMKRGGKRFEIACYMNKVSEFRTGVETDLSEILQIEQVFTNVPKGQVAKKEDWEKAFGTEDMGKAIEEILRRGDLQINAPERTAHLHSLTREIATLIASMTVDPTVSPPRKHTVTIIEKTMSELGYNVRADRPAKAQALELIKRLGEEGSPLSVKRVRMRVRVTVPGKDWKRGGVRDRVMAEVEEVEGEETGMEWEGIVQIDPRSFRGLTDLVNEETKGKGRVESMGSVGG